jgi:hypothetical protein
MKKSYPNSIIRLLSISILLVLMAGCKKDDPETANEIQISAGGTHTLIVKSDNTLWACGSNMFGQLGDGTETDRNAIVKIADRCKIYKFRIKPYPGVEE